MKQICKTVIRLVVLSDKDGGSFDPSECSLEEIALSMDTGSFLGSWSVESNTILSSDKVEAECVAVGNDGTFFDEDDEDDSFFDEDDEDD